MRRRLRREGRNKEKGRETWKRREGKGKREKGNKEKEKRGRGRMGDGIP